MLSIDRQTGGRAGNIEMSLTLLKELFAFDRVDEDLLKERSAGGRATWGVSWFCSGLSAQSSNHHLRYAVVCIQSQYARGANPVPIRLVYRRTADANRDRAYGLYTEDSFHSEPGSPAAPGDDGGNHGFWSFFANGTTGALFQVASAAAAVL